MENNIGEQEGESYLSHLKPNYEIHVIIGMVIILNEIKDYHDQSLNGEAPEDKPLNQFLITTPFNMIKLRDMLQTVFTYYTVEENIKEFFLDLLDAQKGGGLSRYLDVLNENENLYSIKKSVCGDLFQELMLMALDEETTIPLLLNPGYLTILSKSRLPFSDSLLLAMVLLCQGEQQDYAMSFRELLDYLERLQPRTFGCSQQDWEDNQIQYANIDLIGQLIDHDIFRLVDAAVTFKEAVNLNLTCDKIVEAYNNMRFTVRNGCQLPEELLAMLSFIVGQ